MNFSQKTPELVAQLEAEHARPRCAAFLAALAFAALWAYGAAHSNDGWRWHEAGQVWCSTDEDCAAFDEPATCDTDSDCEAQCRIDLRPDEDESICDVEA